jgi:hypothetical protein
VALTTSTVWVSARHHLHGTVGNKCLCYTVLLYLSINSLNHLDHRGALIPFTAASRPAKVSTVGLLSHVVILPFLGALLGSLEIYNH